LGILACFSVVFLSLPPFFLSRTEIVLLAVVLPGGSYNGVIHSCPQNSMAKQPFFKPTGVHSACTLPSLEGTELVEEQILGWHGFSCVNI